MQDDIFKTIEEKYERWKELQDDLYEYRKQIGSGLYEAYEKMQPDFHIEYLNEHLNVSAEGNGSYDYKTMKEQQKKSEEWEQFVLNTTFLKDVKEKYEMCEKEMASIEADMRKMAEPYVEMFEPLLCYEVDIHDIVDIFSILKKLTKTLEE